MLGLSLTKIASGFALVIILTLATLWQLEVRKNDRLAGRLEVTRTDLNQCRANTAELQASINQQNSALERLRDEGAARVAELQERLSARDTARQEAQERADRIASQVPMGDTMCEAVFHALDDMVGD